MLASMINDNVARMVTILETKRRAKQLDRMHKDTLEILRPCPPAEPPPCALSPIRHNTLTHQKRRSPRPAGQPRRQGPPRSQQGAPPTTKLHTNTNAEAQVPQATHQVDKAGGSRSSPVDASNAMLVILRRLPKVRWSLHLFCAGVKAPCAARLEHCRHAIASDNN